MIVLLKYVSGGRPRVFHELVGPGESIEKTDDGTGKGTGKTDDPTPLPNKEKDRLDLCKQWDDWVRTYETRGDFPAPPDDVPVYRQQNIPPDTEGLII